MYKELNSLTENEISMWSMLCMVDSYDGLYAGKQLGKLYANKLPHDVYLALDAGPDGGDNYYAAWQTALDLTDELPEDEHPYGKQGDIIVLRMENGNIYEVNTSLIKRWENATGHTFDWQ